MAFFEVEYSEVSSGGYTLMREKDYEALEKNGWSWRRDAPFNDTTKIFEARSEREAEARAMEEWERLTSCSLSDYWCNCCGPRHNFYTSEVDIDDLEKMRLLKEYIGGLGEFKGRDIQDKLDELVNYYL